MAPLELVGPAVVLTLESDDDVATGERPGEPGRMEDDLGARVAEPDELDRRDGRDDLRGGLGLELVWQGEHRPDLVDGPGHALGDLGMGMAVDHRPEGQQVVEVLVAVDVPESAPLPRATTGGPGTQPAGGRARRC